MAHSPNLSLDYLLPNQTQKHVTVNNNTRHLDAIIHICVQSRSLSVPPESGDGLSYIPAQAASGVWAGHENRLATFQDGVWHMRSPRTGWTAWVRDEGVLLVFVDGLWTEAVPLNEMDRLGIGTPPDPAHALSVAGASTLLSHTGSGHRLSINRAGTEETASVVFQTDFSGNAEIGLLASGALSFKAGNNLDALSPAITLQADTGFTGFGTQTPTMRLHVCDQMDARLMIETTNAGSGGGFDILNSGNGQRWRATGQADLFKIRDHTASLDKLTIGAGPSGKVLLENCGNIGIGTPSPTTKLHIAGIIRSEPMLLSGLPDATIAGGGSLAFVADAPGGARFAYSDGTTWRWVVDGTSLS